MIKFEASKTKQGVYEVFFGKIRIGYVYPVGYFNDRKMVLQFSAPKSINKDPSNRLHPEFLNIESLEEAKTYFEIKSEGLTLENAY